MNKRLIASLALVLTLLLSTSISASTLTTAITIDGKDWAQVRDTTTVFGQEVYILCGWSGVCNGITGSGIDLTGWSWANEEQALKLVNDILGSNFNGTDKILTDTSNWFNHFEATGAGTPVIFTDGIYSGRQMPSYAVQACQWYTENCTSAQFDSIYDISRRTVDRWDTLNTPEASGFFLYQPSEVPVPAAVFMFAPALLGFTGLRRRAKNIADTHIKYGCTTIQ